MTSIGFSFRPMRVEKKKELASIPFVAEKTPWGDRLRGFPGANCTKHETGLLGDDLTDRGVININIHYRENPHPSRLVGDYGSGDAAELGCGP